MIYLGILLLIVGVAVLVNYPGLIVYLIAWPLLCLCVVVLFGIAISADQATHRALMTAAIPFGLAVGVVDYRRRLEAKQQAKRERDADALAAAVVRHQRGRP